MEFNKLCEPGKIGNLEIRNRMVMAPMGTSFCTKEGFAGEDIRKYFEARAKGGAGLIMTGVTAIDPRYHSPGYPALYSDEFIPGFYETINAVHIHGAKFFFQLWHPGRQWSKVVPVAPSSIACRSFMYGDRPIPKELTTGEVEGLVEMFAEGARRARDAGADGVDLHGTHGYLMHQFFSPYTNVRTDKYGGSLERRTTFALEIIALIKEKCGPGFPISIRFGQDHLIPGNNIEETKTIAKILEAAGVVCIGASGGHHEATREKLYGGTTSCMGIPPGWELEDAEAIKSAVRIPVMACGGLGVDLELAERVLEEGKADFIQMGRALLADPELPNKVITGRINEINWCMRCGECHNHDRDNLRRTRLRCTVNAFAGREGDLSWKINRAEKGKKVVIVGGGPGGLEAARIAASRGHDVTLYERNKNLGGEIMIAAIPPGKKDMQRTVQHLSREVERHGVKVELGVEATSKSILKIKPDAVILAVGSSNRMPDIPGADRGKVFFADDVFTGKANQGEKAVILGGGGIGAEVALFLAEKGKTVTILEVLSPEELEKDKGRGAPTRLQKEYYPHLWGVGTDFPKRYRMNVIKRLGELGVKAILGASTKEITSKGIIVRVKGEEKDRVIEADMVVCAFGGKPNRALYGELFGKVPELYLVGDCVQPRRIMDAISEGAYVGLNL